MFGGLSGYSLLIYLTHWSVTRLGVVEVIGTLQLCSGQTEGCEAAMHPYYEVQWDLYQRTLRMKLRTL